jgi:hypothetical protein
MQTITCRRSNLFLVQTGRQISALPATPEETTGGALTANTELADRLLKPHRPEETTLLRI